MNCSLAYTWSRQSVLMPSSSTTVAEVCDWDRSGAFVKVNTGRRLTGAAAGASAGFGAGELLLIAKTEIFCSLPLSNTVKSSLVRSFTGPLLSRTMTLTSTSRVVTRMTCCSGTCAAKATHTTSGTTVRELIEGLDVRAALRVTHSGVRVMLPGKKDEDEFQRPPDGSMQYAVCSPATGGPD